MMSNRWHNGLTKSLFQSALGTSRDICAYLVYFILSPRVVAQLRFTPLMWNNQYKHCLRRVKKKGAEKKKCKSCEPYREFEHLHIPPAFYIHELEACEFIKIHPSSLMRASADLTLFFFRRNRGSSKWGPLRVISFFLLHYLLDLLWNNIEIFLLKVWTRFFFLYQILPSILLESWASGWRIAAIDIILSFHSWPLFLHIYLCHWNIKR